MPTVKVYNLSGAASGNVELPDEVFGAEVQEHLLWEMVKAQRASARRGTAMAKNRSEVNGTSQKMYRQKGTGRARHGSSRAPIFVGGGKAHGPRPRDYGYRPPRKMRRRALQCALSLKHQEGRLTVVEDFDLGEIKTKTLVDALDKLGITRSGLLVDRKGNERLQLSARNIPGYRVVPPEGVNVYDLLRHDHLVVSRAAVEDLGAWGRAEASQTEATASAGA